MNVTVAIESPLQDDVRALVSALSAHLLPLSPREFQFGIGVEEMAEPRTTVFVARDDDGVAVGCGALTVHDDGTGEVKRMFTIPEARGARVGERILSAIIELARGHRLDRLLLETGASPDFASAHRLYARTGFWRRHRKVDRASTGSDHHSPAEIESFLDRLVECLRPSNSDSAGVLKDRHLHTTLSVIACDTE